MFRMHKTMPAPAKSPTHKPGSKTNDPNSLSSLSASSSTTGGLPVLGKVNPNHLLVGNKVWVTDPKVLWRIGEVQGINQEQQSADVYVPDAPDEKLQSLNLGKLYTFDASHIVDHEDVALMNNMHEAPLLSVLRQRFEMDKIYTFTADILLSINPYKTIPLLYDVMGFMEQNKEPADASKRPPHLFTIAEKAYSGMKGVIAGTGTPQSIIISGESGAGKTEASKYIMKYLATASKHASAAAAASASGASASSSSAAAHVHEKIEECVVLSNLILESFGNAKTSRNDNSSRFGKYIQIHYNVDGRMVGVSIRHFLLEKTRLVMPQSNERNYHIFYQLLAGLKGLGSTQEKQLKLQSDVWNYTYLTHGDCVEVDGMDDAVEFDQLRNCLSQLGMDMASFQMPMFEILAAILQLGNVQFQSVKEEGSSNEEKTAVVFPESDQGVGLAHVSALLGVEPQEFAKKMVTQTTITGRGSILEIKLSADQAKNAMDAFCKHLYGELFNHLIARINACAKEHTETAQEKPKSSKSGGASTAPAFIGILDIFGFEVMKKNSLEQLCINFTNETLQQQFNKHVFVLEQERYANEGIEFSIVEFKDNQQCLDLIQKPPTGLLPLLEEQMLLKRKTTDKQLLTIYHGQHLDKHPNYTKPRFECDEFVIRHYAGEVVYDTHDFIAKNTDNLHDDLLDLLKRSSQSLIQAIFAGVATDNKAQQKRGAPVSGSNGSANNKGKQALTGTSTVTSRFRTQLSELMEVLWHTTPNYIKCIKPNNLKFPGGFSCELVRDQLIYSGVLEVVRIRQEGFPIRKRFDVFYELFWSLSVKKYAVANVRKGDAKQQKLRDACEQLAIEWLEEKNPSIHGKKVFAMGRQEVFLRYGQVEKLEAYVASLRAEKAVIIQAKLVRCRIAYRKFQVIKRGVRKFQALWRMHSHKVRYQKMKRAVVKIQAQFRCSSHQKRFRKLKLAASCVFRVTMRFLTHKRFAVWEKQRKAAVLVQKHLRGFLSRTAAERARKLKERSTLSIQSWYRMVKYHRIYVRQRRAIVKIQSEYRSVKMRREFLRRKTASIVLAAFVRQMIQRKKFKMLKQRVVKLQALVRKWKVREQFMSLRKLVVYIQSKRRQQFAKQRMEQRRQAMNRLQHAMKGWLCRCHYVAKMKSAVVLQYWAKSWLLQKEYRQLKLAAKKIQVSWRRHHCVKRWEAEVNSIFGSSSSSVAGSGVGAPSWTQHSRMEESDRRIQKLRQNPALFFHLRPKAYGYNSVFHHAAACGDFHVVKYMLDQNVLTKNELFYMKNGKGNTAFHEACRHGQYEMVKSLIVQARSVFEERAEKPQVSVTEVGTEKRSQIVVSGSDEGSSNSSNQSQDQPHQPHEKAKKAEEPEEDITLLSPPGVVYSGYLKKRRETSRWMKRFVVLSMSESHFPQLDYFANDKPATLHSKSAKTIDLRVALFKKSMDTPFAFEIHSPHLLEGRNKEGRLYFAAENELEIQKWLAHLRHSIPSSIESRIFAMHRGTKYGKLEFIDFALRKKICNLPNLSARRESPLHLAARVNMANVAAAAGSMSVPLFPSSSVQAQAQAPDAKATAVEPAVTVSSISVNADEENNNSNNSNSNYSSSEIIHKPNDSSSCGAEDSSTSLLNVGKTKLEVEADIVRTVLWLIESGAEINAVTAKKETPLKLALRANNLLVAKHLLDRGALATGLSPSELEEAQRLKASLSKNAISSVGCSSSSSRTASASKLSMSMNSLRKKATGGGSPSSSQTPGATIDSNDTPTLFLLKQPGRIRHSSYVSVFVEHIGISNPQYLSRPRIVVSVLDSQRNLVEMKQQVSVQPVVLPSSLLWSITWHMQTPLENLPHGACVVFELTISPTVSATLSTPASSAEDFVPVCWTYIQVDQRTANCMPLNAEMYKYPMDLTLKKLQRVDAFINGDVFVSQGPH